MLSILSTLRQVSSHSQERLIQSFTVNPAYEATVNHFAIGIG